MWTRRHLKDTITYWGPGNSTGYPGRSFATPVGIKGRWEAAQELVVDETGTQVFSSTKVAVDTEVVEQGYLYLGTSTSSDPTTLSGAHRIVSVQKADTLRGEANFIVAYLK